jgi:hypothetical protein
METRAAAGAGRPPTGDGPCRDGTGRRGRDLCGRHGAIAHRGRPAGHTPHPGAPLRRPARTGRAGGPTGCRRRRWRRSGRHARRRGLPRLDGQRDARRLWLLAGPGGRHPCPGRSCGHRHGGDGLARGPAPGGAVERRVAGKAGRRPGPAPPRGADRPERRRAAPR